MGFRIKYLNHYQEKKDIKMLAYVIINKLYSNAEKCLYSNAKWYMGNENIGNMHCLP